MTRVDVVVTARDEAQHLPACLGTILGQRDAHLRLILVDDGSVDATTQIAADAAAADERVTIVRHDIAQGLAAARNAGLAAGSSDWVTFVDGDDLLFPGALHHRLTAASSAPSDTIGVYGDWVSVAERTRRPPRLRRVADRPAAWMVPANKQVPFIASAPLLARELVEALGGFDPRCATAEDAEFWQWWLRLQGRTIYVRKPCVAYRRRAGSMTRRDLAGHFRANRRAFESFDRPLGDDAPPGLLTACDAEYRLEYTHQPRALLAAAIGLAEGRAAEAREVVGGLDPVVLRIAQPSALAAGAIATARRRIRGTNGARAALARLDGAAGRLHALIEENAAPVPSRDELVAAATWLRSRRNLPEAPTA